MTRGTGAKVVTANALPFCPGAVVGERSPGVFGASVSGVVGGSRLGLAARGATVKPRRRTSAVCTSVFCTAKLTASTAAASSGFSA